MNFKFTDFDWFKRGEEIQINDSKIVCSEVKDRNQKIIIPSPEVHLTFSISDRLCELHATDQGKSDRPRRSIFNIDVAKAKKQVLSSFKRVSKQDGRFISLNDMMLSKFILIDPAEKSFLSVARYFSDESAMLPTYLIKKRTNMWQLRRKGRKFAYLFDSFGFFKGQLILDFGNNRALFTSKNFNISQLHKFVDLEISKKRIIEEGFTEDKNFEESWQKWISFLHFLQSIRKKIRKIF